MSVEWETVVEGRFRVATLTAGPLRARVMNYGATLLSLELPDVHGRTSDVLLGFDSPAQYLGKHPYFSAVIGRYGNRIAGARFSLDGRVCPLTANEGRNQLHGGLRGFDKVWWTSESQASQQSEVTWRYSSAAGEEGYPGKLEVQATYSLTESALQLDLVATCDAPTVVNLTHHAYWNLAGQGDVRGHELQLLGAHFLPVNSALIPTGQLERVRGTPMDFLRPRAIGARLQSDDPQLRDAKGGYDHCWALDREGPGLQPAARLKDPSSGRVMELFTTQPGLQFYSGNQLDGSLTGKRGVAYPKYGGLCLEPQHFPDSPNQPHFPSTVLRPGEAYRQHMQWRFSVSSSAGGDDHPKGRLPGA